MNSTVVTILPAGFAFDGELCVGGAGQAGIGMIVDPVALS
jgi:hypothetical protein